MIYNNFLHKQLPKCDNLVELPIIAPKNPTPSDFKWGEVHPYLELKVPWCRGRFLGSKNSFSLKFCVELKKNLKLEEG